MSASLLSIGLMTSESASDRKVTAAVAPLKGDCRLKALPAGV